MATDQNAENINALQYRSLPKMPTASYARQYTRQHISDTWEPKGFQRFASQEQLLKEMSVLGGPQEAGGGNPDRYRPVGPLEDDFPIH